MHAHTHTHTRIWVYSRGDCRVWFEEDNIYVQSTCAYVQVDGEEKETVKASQADRHTPKVISSVLNIT